MPYSKEHKQKSRERILASAAKQFTGKGYDNVSIDEIMADAEMTRGAFYAHFRNKSELYMHAIKYAAMQSPLVSGRREQKTDEELFYHLLDGYLSMEHLDRDMPCPMAFLVTDVANRDPQVRKTYTHSFIHMNKLIADKVKSFSDCSENTLMALTAMMIGSVAIGRALDDPKTVTALLENSRYLFETIIKSS